MNVYQKPEQVDIVYFSGTGSTRRVADQFATSFLRNNVNAYQHELNTRDLLTRSKANMLVVIYPVYATNAPKPIYEFIRKLSIDGKCPSVVISVSGGGEVTPNNACRLHCIKRLEKKGYPVVYEQMIVMPSNFVVATPDELAIRLLEVLPYKIDKIVTALLSGVIRRDNPNLLNRIISFVGELEKTSLVSGLFGRCIKVNSNCTGCGICHKGCPVENIKLVNQLPVFGGKCTICLKCIYSCPVKALTLGIGRFIILKTGYPLEDWENQMNGEKKSSIDDLTKGYAFSGLRKYLKEDIE